MMNCPRQIADIPLAILEAGLLAIRARGSEGRADHCALEADHLHNLPRLLEEYHPELLLYYWDVERAVYIEQATPEPLASYEPLWQRLESHVAAIRRPTRLP
jgi:hypothetical protein